jgi:hypothetical protein
LEAEISLEYDDVRIAEAITNAVSPDNSVTPKGLLVKTRRDKRKVVTSIKCHQAFQTFISTIDDLLFSVATAERTLRETAKMRV